MESRPQQVLERAKDIIALACPTVRAAVARVVEVSADQLVSHFYHTVNQDHEAPRFLSHDLVTERLQSSLRRWLTDLFDPAEDRDLQALIGHQKTIGEVHARIRVPIYLVMQGADVLKVALSNRLREAQLGRDELWMAVVYANNLMDFAIEIMSQTFISSATARLRTDEAYRLFSLGQDTAVDRQSQRAALLEWSQAVLFAIFGPDRPARLPPLAASDFGLWLRHRAGVMFQGSVSLSQIELITRRMDGDLLLRMTDARDSDPGALQDLLGLFQSAVSEMKFLLSDMFQSVAAIENGRDPLTRTLNRRFLPSILSREIALSARSNTKFSIVMLDVDHFKSINDAWGHPVGDAVLAQVADVILDTCRLNDFVFRYGGEEFLVALVESDSVAAWQAAERIRLQVEQQDFRTPDNLPLSITLSVGVATYDGHPDYSYLIQAADRALYEAKRDGRNRTRVAEPPLKRVG